MKRQNYQFVSVSQCYVIGMNKNKHTFVATPVAAIQELISFERFMVYTWTGRERLGRGRCSKKAFSPDHSFDVTGYRST